MSIARWNSYRILGRRLREMAARETPPDVIVTGIPSLEWCETAVEFGARHDVPVVLDVRDLWPDIYLHALPPTLRGFGNLAIAPLRARARRLCRSATAIYGVSQAYLEWGLEHADRNRNSYDRVFPLGYCPVESDPTSQAATLDSLVQQGVAPHKTICMFAGLIERLYDLESIVAAAEQLERRHPGEYQFVICGAGSKSAKLAERASRVSNVLTLGWVEQSTIAALMSVAKIGLATYMPDAPQSLPNKPFEYMAGGLAIVTSLAGELPELLTQHACGTTYRPGDASSLAAAIESMANDSTKLEAMQISSRHLFKQHFDSKSIYANFCDSLVELANQSTLCSSSQAA